MSTSMPPQPPPKPHKPNTNHTNNNNNTVNDNNRNSHELEYNSNDDEIENSYSSSLPPEEEQVVMTPKGKTSNSTVLLIERKLVEDISERVHVAGGDHKGIIINKDALKGVCVCVYFFNFFLNNYNFKYVFYFLYYLIEDQKSQHTAPHLSLEFRVFLVSANTGQHSQESRFLRFWFRSWVTDVDIQAHVAQDFFTKLVTPTDFPRGELFSIYFCYIYNVIFF